MGSQSHGRPLSTFRSPSRGPYQLGRSDQACEPSIFIPTVPVVSNRDRSNHIQRCVCGSVSWGWARPCCALDPSHPFSFSLTGGAARVVVLLLPRSPSLSCAPELHRNAQSPRWSPSTTPCCKAFNAHHAFAPEVSFLCPSTCSRRSALSWQRLDHPREPLLYPVLPLGYK